ncbi:MAG: right-handed parallel beta-helix repeat-containing protein [Lachnospiraceae bacterium]|nr:right-handed parallel beta-helix repeat-containing protein [Lachnospiraceae bacterium]
MQVDFNGTTSSGSSSSGSSSGSSSSGSSSSGSTITVKNGGTSLADAVKKAKAGDTIVIDGTVKSGAISLPAKVNISGKNNATIDFSQTSGSSGRGITLKNDGSTIENITVKNASDNGIYITGSNNTFKYVTCCYNQDAGFQISDGGANNKFYNCTSHHNADAAGENADGFAVKLHSGEGNYFENCVAEYNSDDGWDCYAAHGAVTLVNCQANYNGLCDGIMGDGNGFKMGGVDNKTPGVAAHLDPLNHTLIGCTAKGNYASGFDRNNQSGVVTMKNCIADSNKKYNYNWPASGTPSALGYKVTFGKAIIQDCTSKNGKNNIGGATLKGTNSGF